MSRWYNSRPMHIVMVGTTVITTIFAVLMTVALAFELALEVWWFTFVDLIPDEFFDHFFAIGVTISTLASVVALWTMIDSLIDLHVVNRSSYEEAAPIKFTATHNLISNTLILLFATFLLSSLLLGVRFPPVGLHESLWVLRMLLASTLLILATHLRVYRFRMRDFWLHRAVSEDKGRL